MDQLFEKTVLDLGNIQYGEKNVNFSFNYLGRPDVIQRLFVGCGSCTVAQYDSLTNNVSGHLIINAVTNAAPPQPTAMTKNITIEWNDGQPSFLQDPITKVREWNPSKKTTKLELKFTLTP